MKFVTKPIQQLNNIHLALGMLLHYLLKLKIQIFCRYAVYMEEDINKLHFQYINFNSSTHVTVYAELVDC